MSPALATLGVFGLFPWLARDVLSCQLQAGSPQMPSAPKSLMVLCILSARRAKTSLPRNFTQGWWAVTMADILPGHGWRSHVAFSWQAERESCVAVQYSTPWKNTCLFQSLPAPIIIPAQLEEKHSEPFQHQAAEVSCAPPAFPSLLFSTLDPQCLKWATGNVSFFLLQHIPNIWV